MSSKNFFRQMSALENSGFLYDSTMVAPLNNPPYWPYPLAFSTPHRCFGNAQKCPTRSHSVMEMVMNEIDPREEPGNIDEQVSGCSMLDSCTEIRNADSLYNVLTHNFIRYTVTLQITKSSICSLFQTFKI